MSRANVFNRLTHAERVVEHALEPPRRPRPAPASAPPRSVPRLPEPAALATAAARLQRPKPKVTIPILPRPLRPGHVPMLSAKSLKVTLVLTPEQVAAIPPPQGKSAPLVIAVGGRQIQASVNAKSLRKAIATIDTHGPANCVVILQGKLAAGDILAEAGIATNVKAKLPE